MNDIFAQSSPELRLFVAMPWSWTQYAGLYVIMCLFVSLLHAMIVTKWVSKKYDKIIFFEILWLGLFFFNQST